MAIKTVDELIVALGGNSQVQQLFGVEIKPNVVGMWRVRGVLPPRSYVVLERALKRRRLKAPAALWDMYPPRNGK